MNILNTLEADFECPLLGYTTSLETMPATTVSGPGVQAGLVLSGH